MAFVLRGIGDSLAKELRNGERIPDRAVGKEHTFFVALRGIVLLIRINRESFYPLLSGFPVVFSSSSSFRDRKPGEKGNPGTLNGHSVDSYKCKTWFGKGIRGTSSISFSGFETSRAAKEVSWVSDGEGPWGTNNWFKWISGTSPKTT